jgi:hypothetical protein
MISHRTLPAASSVCIEDAGQTQRGISVEIDLALGGFTA